MNRYVCIHGHFYQPPRENPWLEDIEPQISAHPYHNWNDRITAECYAPNAASRILDSEKRIISIINNYSKISFNFGPTLLSWMEKYKPEVYQAILDADKKSQERFSGHGSAIAQVYNHMIMPLANYHDKYTQVIWGIRDFEYRFSRKPEGMWLAETAVDIKTLEILASQNILFTILSPYQAKRMRKIGGKIWRDARGGKIDPTIPYSCQLPSGKKITIFFYDGPISHDISFGGLLGNGEGFAQRMMSVFSDARKDSQLSHIATDGETYGHHHRFGEMALSYCLNHIESSNLAQITIYGEYLEKHPPTNEVEIIENSSWSCMHGIERWRADCGCCSGANPGWSQKWRPALRQAFDYLRDALIPIFENEMRKYFKEPWDVRNAYIKIILNRSSENVDDFISSSSHKELSSEEKIKVLKLLEMQRHAMLMYTSCGWFFDDISGIETIQIIQYAVRAIQLAKEITGTDLENSFVEIIKCAPGNTTKFKTGKDVYDTFAKPAVIDFLRIGAHYAISSLFENYGEDEVIYCYSTKRLEYKRQSTEKQGLAIGKVLLTSTITREQAAISFCISYLGDYNLVGGVSNEMKDETFNTMHQQIRDTFLKCDSCGVVRLMDKYFSNNKYSLKHLFKNEQNRVLSMIFDSTLNEIEDLYRQAYKLYHPFLQIEKDLPNRLPKALSATAEFIVNRELKRLLEADECDLEKLKERAIAAQQWSLELDRTQLGFVVSKRITGLMNTLAQKPQDLSTLQKIETLLQTVNAFHFDLNLWEAQNIYFDIGKNHHETIKSRADKGDQEAKQWTSSFKALENYLHTKVA